MKKMKMLVAVTLIIIRFYRRIKAGRKCIVQNRIWSVLINK
jgi:hypothetical protein